MLIFVHIEKTAGTTFTYILRASHGYHHCDTYITKKSLFREEDYQLAKKVFPGVNSMAGHNLVEPTRYFDPSRHFFFTILREPINRCASYYQDGVLRRGLKKPFTDWIREEKFHNMQVKRIAGEENVEKAYDLLENSYGLVGLTERFNETLQLLRVLYPGKLSMRYSKRVIAKNNEIKKSLLSSTANLELLKKYNSKDIELYNKVARELFPNYLLANKKELEKMEDVIVEPRGKDSFNQKASILYNKYIYKPMVRVSGKK
jgi:hypothetical protein